jgi:hypothetical protein
MVKRNLKEFCYFILFFFDFSWDYNYTVGEIAGRRMDCNCGSAECRRRVL